MQDLGPEPGRSVTDLVASCIEAVERDGLAAIELFCRDHPERAAKIRQRLGILHTLGLLRPPTSVSAAQASKADSDAARPRAHRAAGPGTAEAPGPDRSEVDRDPE